MDRHTGVKWLNFSRNVNSTILSQRFLHFKFYKIKLLSSKLYREGQFKLLNIEIKSRKKFKICKVLSNQVKTIDQDLLNSV